MTYAKRIAEIPFVEHTVTVLDERSRPVAELLVMRRCRRCERVVHGDKWDSPRVFWEVVSPAGTEHIAGEDGFGTTGCGIDASGDDWWWQL